jgi:hypothetical protein
MRNKSWIFIVLFVSVTCAWYFSGGGLIPPSERMDLSMQSYAEDASVQFKMPAAQRQDLNKKYKDPWGTYVRVDYSNSLLKLTSAGKDKIFGTSDDIVHEEKLK